jgi:hypothetical protein
MSIQDDTHLHPVGAELNNAIWEAAWFAVDCHCDKDEFIAMVTKAANEAFDAQVNNKAKREERRDGKYLSATASNGPEGADHRRTATRVIQIR